jgi:type 1 glutamine amidotransferase
MSARNWKPGNGHHSARHDFTVDIKDANHPIAKGLKTPLPVQNEELYSNLKWQPEGTYHVLATAYDDHSLYDDRASDARNKQPMSGAESTSRCSGLLHMARVAFSSPLLAHDADTTAEPTFKMTRGAKWAATGKVTFPIPSELAGT